MQYLRDLSKGEKIEAAREAIDLYEAADLAQVSLESWGNAKTWCPFGNLYHEDGGISKAFRVYDGGKTGYCFACQKYYDPVILLAQAQDLTKVRAAEKILEYKGLFAQNYQERWDDLQHETVSVDTIAYHEALDIWLRREIPNWNTRQLESDVLSLYNKLTNLLPKVHTVEDGQQWLSAAKKVMRRFK